MVECSLSCNGYIPERKIEDFPDLDNPFIVHDNNQVKSPIKTNKCIFKNKTKKKDELMIILCFLLFLLCAKFLYY